MSSCSRYCNMYSTGCLFSEAVFSYSYLLLMRGIITRPCWKSAPWPARACQLYKILTGNVSSNIFSFSPLNCYDLDEKYYFQITITFPNSIKGKLGQFKSHWPQCVVLTWSELGPWLGMQRSVRIFMTNKNHCSDHRTDLNYFLRSHSQLPPSPALAALLHRQYECFCN